MKHFVSRHDRRTEKGPGRRLRERFRRSRAHSIQAADLIAIHLHLGRDGRSHADADLVDALEDIRRRTA